MRDKYLWFTDTHLDKVTPWKLFRFIRHLIKENPKGIFLTGDISNGACRQCFSGNGFGDKDASVGGNFLVGYKGKLYNLEADYQVGVPKASFDAVGCGSDLALGAMFATEGLPPEQRINAALAAASTFSAGVAPPFTILRLEGDNKKPKPRKKTKRVAK